ncbi:MAG: amino acid adenylation domain-containing protein [Pseudomonadota bacterium]
MTDDAEFDPFAGADVQKTVPLTPEQEEIWLSVEIGGTPANLAYNEAIVFHLRGPLDEPALRRALDGLIARHEALRATVSGDGRALCVTALAAMPFTRDDLASAPAAERARAVEGARRAAVTAPFDLVRGPLVRARLLRVADQEHVLLLVAHHIVCDGWSGAVLVDELGRLYATERRGTPADLPPPVSFAAHALERQREETSPEARAAHAYWIAQFRDVPPALDLPTDRARLPERSFDADRVDVALPADLVRRLKAVGAQHGASLVMVLFGAVQAFLHRVTGQSSVVVGMAAAGQAIASVDALVGHCVRTLPIRAEIAAEESFVKFLARTRKSVLDALDNAQVTFGSLVKELALPRGGGRIPLVSIMFNVDPEVGAPAFEGLEVAVSSVPRAYENFEIFLNGSFRGGDLVLETSFSAHLFDRATIESRLAELTAFLEDIARRPDSAIGDLEILSAAEKEFVRAGATGASVDIPAQTVCASFLARVVRAPDRPAVTFGGRSLTYRQLDDASAAVAAALAARKIGPGGFVGVCLSRSADLVVGLLGIMRSGAAYVPLDPEYPRERLAFIAADARLDALLTERAIAGTLDLASPHLLIEECGSAPAAAGARDASRSEAPAYVMYTSGSTGKPKGVVIQHRNVTNFLASMARRPGLTEGDVLVAVTTPSFDISVLEIFLPLVVGARVVLAATDDVTDGNRLATLLVESGATVMQATPSGWRVLLDAGWTGKTDLKALTGGEALGDDLARALLPRTASLWNCYGPTETTIWSTLECVTAPPITIGRPIANTQVYVLDGRRRLVPPGVVGELFIGGAGVAQGYLGRAELTAERFVPDPFAERPGGRLYRTGDLARLRLDGRLEWLGRSDFQVKVRGHRIELGEIEARLAECAGVGETVVTVREVAPGDQRVVAYLRPQAGAPAGVPNEALLRRELAQRLPRDMVPQHFVLLDSFPRTPNGKVDRANLPAPGGLCEAAFRPPETEIQTGLAQEMFQLLGVARVGLDDDFFALGGHSLLALRLAARVRVVWGVDIPMRELFSLSTLKALADFIEAALMVRRRATAASASTTQDQEEFLL